MTRTARTLMPEYNVVLCSRSAVTNSKLTCQPRRGLGCQFLSGYQSQGSNAGMHNAARNGIVGVLDWFGYSR